MKVRRKKGVPPPSRALVRARPAALDQVPPELRPAVAQALANAPGAQVVVVVVQAAPAAPAPPVGSLVVDAATAAFLATVRDLVGEMRYARGQAAPEEPTAADLAAREEYRPPTGEPWKASAVADELFARFNRQNGGDE